MDDRYCYICGKKLKISRTGRYYPDTGKPIMDYDQCEVRDCEHGYHTFGPRKSIVERIFLSFSAVVISKCVVCGKRALMYGEGE